MLETNRPDQPEVVTADLPPVPSEPTISYDEPIRVTPAASPPPAPKGPSRLLAALLGGALVAGGFGIGVAR